MTNICTRLFSTLVTVTALGTLDVGAAQAADTGARKPTTPTDVMDELLKIPAMSQADCDKRFAEFDGNRDGKLTYLEFAKGRFGQVRFIQAPSEREVKGFLSRYTATARSADANHDGWLTRREHVATCTSDLP